MANTYYDSQLTAAEIEAALEAIDGVIVPANNGKVLAINNGKLEARSVQWGGGGASIEPLSVTQNGTYTASSGVDGYSPITVNVSGGGGGFVVDEYSRLLIGIFDTESSIESGNTIEVAFYANSYVNDGHIVGQSYNSSGEAFHLTTYSNRWYVGGIGEANFAADSDCPLSGADIVYKAKTGEIRMNGVVKTTSFTMPNQPSYTYKLNTRGGSVSTNGVYKYKYVKVYDSNNNLICHWEFGHVQLGNLAFYAAHEKVNDIYKEY